ncbi:MAG: 4Fe-4S dicluster domain-containing protein [Rikenellaceae bacterium]
MAKIKGAIVVDIQRCKGCGICVTACPLNVLEMSTEVNDKGYTYALMAAADKCTGCASCGIICPDSCIKVYRAKSE